MVLPQIAQKLRLLGSGTVLQRRFWAGLCVLGIIAAPAMASAAQRVRERTTPVVARLRPLREMDPHKHLQLAISLPLRDPKGLAALLAQLQQPGSPMYHKYLTPAEFTRRFGPSAADYRAAVAFATAHHLSVTAEHSNRMILDVDGAVPDVEKALHVHMRVYRHPTEARTFYAPDADPSVDLGVPVLHISGLNDYEPPRPRLQAWHAAPPVLGGLFKPADAKSKSVNGSGPDGYYMGDDFRAAYVPGTSLTGSGQTVALLQYDGYTPADITYYENATGRPNVPLRNVLLDGFDGKPTGNGGEVEVSLDIEMVIAMAPGLSKIIVYEAGPNGNWHDILNRMATDDAATELSCSWYSPGAPADPVADQIFQEMAAQGQSFFSASGDNDAFTGLIPFPGDSPYITEVGGTLLTTATAGGAYVSETAWNRNDGVGSGGGISTQYPIPSWQQGIGMVANLGSTTMRNVPDVAFTADDVYVRADGLDYAVGGTSCAAPLWAAFAAMINQEAAQNAEAPVGFINPAIYALCSGTGYAGGFHDITVGDNFSSSSPSNFPAVAGYDLCTGWGSPNGLGLIYALAGPPTPVLITGTSLPSGIVGSVYSEAINAAGGTPPYTFGGANGNLPAGLTLGSSGVLSGTPSAVGNSSFTVQVTDSAGVSSSTGFVLAVYSAGTPLIANGSPLATGTLGVPYLLNFSGSGGAAPYTWAVVSGSLPNGLNLAGDGVLSGTPLATGTFGFSVQVTGSDGLASAFPFTMVVPTLPVITSAPWAAGVNGGPFVYQIDAAGNPTSFGASGLPAGLTVDGTTGLISGTPTSAGKSKVTVRATNNGGTVSGTVWFHIAQMPPPVITMPFQTLYSFGTDGTQPVSGLIQGNDGNLYGTASAGGLGFGTVFQMTTDGTATTLGYLNGANGIEPLGGLLQANDGSLYGTAEQGGANGGGTIYQLVSGGSINAVYSFDGSAGFFPTDQLLQAADGNLYGTAMWFGPEGGGTVFEMALGGSPGVLAGLGQDSGYNPADGVIQASDGNFYGTAQSGGAYNEGTVFSVTPGGTVSTLASFTGTNGQEPIAGLVQGSDGNLYGTTYQGGPNNDGTIFQVSLSGSMNTLYSFSGSDGANPVGGLIQGTDGNFYGTTFLGGSNNDGTLFSITSSGSLTTLCSFTGTNGSNPQGALMEAANSVLYGTTTGGGASNEGTVFSLTPFTVTVGVGAPFSYQITASSNTPPSGYAAANLPPGLTVNSATGLVSGTPTTIGTSNVTISATNPGGTATANLTIDVRPGAPVIASALSATGTAGIPFQYQIGATNNPASYGVSGLPAGLTFNIHTGLISGIATLGGTSSVTISATDVGGTGTARLFLTMQASFAGWQEQWFDSVQMSDPTISGETATPAGDGIPNLMKYALNLNPMTNGASGLPVASSVTQSGSSYLTLTYNQNLSAPDVTFVPEVSGDLRTWNSGPGFIETVSVTPNADRVTESVTVQDLTPTAPGVSRFIRLRVVGP